MLECCITVSISEKELPSAANLWGTYEENAGVFDKAFSNYLAEYEKVGICPKRYRSVEEFAKIR